MAELGSDTTLLRLIEEPDAKPANGFTGLYHVALLLPDRASLGRFLAHVTRNEIALTGRSGHEVSEAIYLRDPDGRGIEIYADRPHKQWEGLVIEAITTGPLESIPTLPLDTASLLAEGEDVAFDDLPGGTVVGHVHLCIRDIDETVRFYRDLLGMTLIAQAGPAAAFFSAGVYHHHLGANTWDTLGAPPAPPGTARLRHATIVLPDRAERDRLAAAVGATEERADGLLVRDPSGNPLLLAA